MKPREDEKVQLGLPYPSVQPTPSSPGRAQKRFKKAFLNLFLFLGLGLSCGLWTGSLSLNLFHRKSRSYDDYVRRIEGEFLGIPSAKSALANSRRFATYPHIAGAASDFDDASQILRLFQQELNITQSDEEPVFPAGSPESRQATLGITSEQKHPSAWIDVYYPVLNTAKSEDLSLQLLDDDSNAVWTADLLEDGNEGDKEAATYRDAIAPFHGLSASGEAIGHIVYANYGTKDDFDQLIDSGVDFTGKIVLARYGANFRGLKVQAAEDYGAAGVLIYSDPRDDGDVTVENGYLPYPDGPARNPTAIQRGSVMYLSMYPGDPATPGYPAYENATRVESSNVPRIPSLPISWNNAQVLLEELGGTEEGRKLSGKIGSRKVKMVNQVDTKVTPIWNTMAAIPGHVKDEVVIIGCHRDAWVMGAADPTSGTVSLIEVVKGLGALLKKGWKPLRTILIASWDAEEYGLVGSTEYGEDFAQWIQEHAVAYINVDVSVGGSSWSSAASPSLVDLIRRSAEEIPHPTDASRTLWDAQTDVGPFVVNHEANISDVTAQVKPSVGPLGSGSDYTVFLQRLGVASSDEGFGMTTSDAVYHYHSIYDSQFWQETYADPGFHRHVAVAKHLGLLSLRLADSIILPLNTTHYANELDVYVDTTEAAAAASNINLSFEALRGSIASLQEASAALDSEKASAEKALRKALQKLARKRWRRRFVRHVIRWVKKHLGMEVDPLGLKDAAPYEHGHLLDHSLKMLSARASDVERLEKRWGKGPLHDLVQAAKRVRKANAKLAKFEQGFISEDGIRSRNWYKHLGVAPGRYLGYGATTLPALTEAVMFERNASLIQFEEDRLITLIDTMTHNLLN